MEVQSTLLFIAASVNSFLSLFVLLGKRSKVNIIYSIFVLFASMWAVGLAFFLLQSDIATSLYIANFYYISAAGIPVFFLYFSLLFLNDENKHNILQLVIIIPFLLLVFVFIFDKNFLIQSIFFENGAKNVVLNNIDYLIYSIYFFIFVCLSYLKLLNSYFGTKNLEEKKQLKFIIWGTLIGFIFGMLFNLFLPSMGDYQHIFLGPLFSFSMVASIAYSITKHHLFSMKVIVTEILMFVLWVFIFIRTIVSVTVEDQLINAGLLGTSILVGIFLIRSVIKEVRQREEIQKLADELKQANQGQANLMHFMNHQIKGRLGNVKNIFAELMTDDYGVMPEFAKPLLEKGLDEADVGVNYVQNILKGASAESGTLPFDMKPIDFKEVLENAAVKQKDHAEKKGLVFNLSVSDADYHITGDNVELGEAVRNLIDNSINYTETGSIDVKLYTKDNKIMLTVKDTGIGLTDEDKTKLFKSGGRGTESVKINVNSTGYGLVFVKGVIEAHKGRVWAESEGRGKGSSFFVELPKK
jgi:signal transduction histidine kinase